MEWIQILVLAFLIIISIIDIKSKGKVLIPSFLTTFAILVVGIVNIVNVPFGILAGILGWFMTDIFEDDLSNFMSGLADVKITIVLGLMISSVISFLLLCLFIAIGGVLYKIAMIKINPKAKEVPFSPMFLIVYVIMLLMGVI